MSTMSTWVNDTCVSFFQHLCIQVVKCGRVPQHIAFIMDGNRRYAKKLQVKSSAGHSKGFSKLSEILKWCLDLGVPEVTVYAFSIENFKRTEEEVNGLMDLAGTKFKKLLDEIDQINKWGVRLHVAGRLSLLPEDLRALVANAMVLTRHNNKLRFNIAYFYPTRDEITRAASQLVEGVRNEELSAEDIDEELMAETLELSPPDLLVRTSGEVRLSDFMLWQISDTVLYFSDVLWPEFTIWNLLAAIIHFQRHAAESTHQTQLSGRKLKFLHNLEDKRWQQLEIYISKYFV